RVGEDHHGVVLDREELLGVAAADAGDAARLAHGPAADGSPVGAEVDGRTAAVAVAVDQPVPADAPGRVPGNKIVLRRATVTGPVLDLPNLANGAIVDERLDVVDRGRP